MSTMTMQPTHAALRTREATPRPLPAQRCAAGAPLREPARTDGPSVALSEAPSAQASTGQAPTGQAPTGQLRLTRRGRAVLTLVFLAALLVGMASLGGWATATLSGGTAEPVSVVEVQPGDTLYDLASDVAAPGQVREMVYRIQELNSLPGAQISEGQRLAVPRG